MKKLIKKCITICIILALITIPGFLFFYFGHPGNPGPEPPFPKAGTWTCAELGITLFLDTGECIVNDGEDEIKSYILREQGSCRVSIYCNEFDNPKYPFDYRFFSGDFLSIDGEVFYIQDHKSEAVYIFSLMIE